MTADWHFQPIFDSYLLVGVIAVGLVMLLFVGPSFGNLGRRRQRTLTVLRAVLFLLVMFALLRPARVRTEKRVRTATVVLLVDASRSMQVSDAESGKTRWNALRDALARVTPQLDEMGENFEIELLAFSDQIKALPRSDGTQSIELPAEPEGNQSDIGTCLLNTVKERSGQRLAGIVLMSDGAQRAYSPQVEPQQAARELARRATPLYTVAFGRSRDQTQARDVAVESLQDQYTVYEKNEFQLQAGIRIQGYVGESIPVHLQVEAPDGSLQQLGPVMLQPSRDSQQMTAEFIYVPIETGQYKLTVQAASQPGETGTENNELSSFLTVLEGGMRVLLVTSSLLHQEQKYLRHSLDESPDIQLDFQVVDVRTRGKWPIDLSTDVDLDEYDVFIIGDLDAQALSANTWRAVARLVENGKGLMMYGFHSFGPAGYYNTALRDVLPITMDSLERQTLDPSKPLRADVHLPGPIQMLPTQPDSITHLAPDDQNLATWKSLKPLDGANRFGRVKDFATVLARAAPSDEFPQGAPLLVKSSAVGRVLAFAGYSTHRWLRYGRKEAHKRFWRQAVLWLAYRDQSQADDVWVLLRQRRFRPGSRVEFTAGVRDSTGDPLTDVDLEAEVTGPSGGKTAVRLVADGDHWTGDFSDTASAGDYRLEVRASRGGEQLDERAADFVVLDQDLELSDPAADPALLELLAKLTERSGGKALAAEQLPSLLAEIKSKPPEDQIETQTKWQLGDTPIDAWLFFLSVVAILGSEWYLRKRWGLV